MKTSFRVFLAGLLLAPAALLAASFEGKVSFKMTSGRGQPQEIKYNIKGDKVRIEMPGQKSMGGMIMGITVTGSSAIDTTTAWKPERRLELEAP